MDLWEESGRYVLRADLPGIEASEVDIQVEDGRLVLRGERRLDPGVEREAYLRIERPHGRFLVQVALPPSIDAHEVRATQRNGVLEISLPKKKEQASARVPVKTD
jgi:HSP20 family protein